MISMKKIQAWRIETNKEYAEMLKEASPSERVCIRVLPFLLILVIGTLIDALCGCPSIQFIDSVEEWWSGIRLL